jgi:hypothetical protein
LIKDLEAKLVAEATRAQELAASIKVGRGDPQALAALQTELADGKLASYGLKKQMAIQRAKLKRDQKVRDLEAKSENEEEAAQLQA